LGFFDFQLFLVILVKLKRISLTLRPRRTTVSYLSSLQTMNDRCKEKREMEWRWVADTVGLFPKQNQDNGPTDEKCATRGSARPLVRGSSALTSTKRSYPDARTKSLLHISERKGSHRSLAPLGEPKATPRQRPD
jgi:hypothetical protein